MEQNKASKKGMNRRNFLTSGSAAIVGATVSGMGFSTQIEIGADNEQFINKELSIQRGSYKDMVKKAIGYRKIDCHNHTGNIPDMLESMDRMGIQWVAISDLEGPDTPESIRASNDVVLKIIKEHPNRFFRTMQN